MPFCHSAVDTWQLFNVMHNAVYQHNGVYSSALAGNESVQQCAIYQVVESFQAGGTS